MSVRSVSQAAPKIRRSSSADSPRVRARKPDGKKPREAKILSYAEAMALAKKWEAKAPPLKPGEKSLDEILRDSPLRDCNAELEKRGLPRMEFDRSLPPEDAP